MVQVLGGDKKDEIKTCVVTFAFMFSVTQCLDTYTIYLFYSS